MSEVFLRFPGQWGDEVWETSGLGGQGYYNVFRWYEVGTGRYLRPDPLGLTLASSGGELNLFAYVGSSPLNSVDPLPLDRLFGLLRGRVINFSPCCVLASKNSAGGGQQQFWIPPRSSVLATDVDAVYFGSGAALKIPDGDLLTILTCQETSFSGEFKRERNGSLGGVPNVLRPARLQRRLLKTPESQEREFGGAILPPTSKCCE